MENLTTILAGAGTTVSIDWAVLVSIALVLAIAAAALWLLQVAVRGVARGILQRKEPERELAQKAKTLSQVVETTGRITIFTIAGLTILSLIGKDITPLLASAGIAGIAIGFGAQNIIKDWLGGFFILLENQYSVDDVIKVGNYAGTVEKMDLRRTVLRGLDGSVVVIPNGEVRVVTNLTKEWSRVVMDIGISYDEDIDRALETMRRVGEEMAADEEVGKLILEPPEVLGVEALAESQITLRMLVKTLPLKQWTVARALRARLRKAFAQEGIEIPYPHRVTIAKLQPMGAWDAGLSMLVPHRERPE